MSAQRPTRPATQTHMVQRQTIDDPALANRVMSDAIGAVEMKVGKLQKLVTTAPTVTGSKAGNAALASLITTLASLGVIKDGTT